MKKTSSTFLFINVYGGCFNFMTGNWKIGDGSFFAQKAKKEPSPISPSPKNKTPRN